jgi:uncharacterized phage-associated protein
MTEDVDDIAALVLARTGTLTAWKLQKLVYYAQAWHLVRHDVPLFDAEIQAWANGPVVRRLYNQHRHRYEIDAWTSGDAASLGGRARALVEWVLRTYGGLTAAELSRLTHAETPWLAAREGLPQGATSTAAISHDAMRRYYGRQVMSGASAAAEAIASAALEGYALPAADVALVGRVAAGVLSADDAVATVAGRYSRSA